MEDASGWEARLRRVGELVREYYEAPHRGALARARREEDDLFLLLVFSEMMGIPNPASYYTLELLPVLYDRFHDWHTRMGMERSPLDNFRCC
ncbi:MAG: cory-CC-star protein [Gemmatimonadota bacterium]